MKYKVETPEKTYNGLSASVVFKNGIGNTDDDYLADWFRKHGYTVTEQEESTVAEVKKGRKKAGE